MKNQKDDNLCVMPFKHMNIKLKGHISACWRNHSNLGNFNETGLKEIWEGNQYGELRESILNNIRHEACRSCWELEDSGSRSTRMVENDSDIKLFEEIRAGKFELEKYPKSIELRFGNICNMACRHCSSINSSNWAKIAKKNPELAKVYDEFNQTGEFKLRESLIDEVTEMAPYLEEVVISGGEPLIQKDHYDCLINLLSHSSQIHLSYNTNLTQISYGDINVIDLWEKFKSADIRISLDSDEEYYSYVRHGAKYNDIKSNIDKLVQRLQGRPGFFIYGTYTISLYNITRVNKFIMNACELGIYFHSSFVQYPEALSIQNLTQKLKEKVSKSLISFLKEIEDEDHLIWKKHSFWTTEKNRIKQFKRIQKFGLDILDFMNSGEKRASLSAGSVEYLTAIDNIHGGDWKKLYPEFLEEE